jgi:serine/threonine protein kinase
MIMECAPDGELLEFVEGKERLDEVSARTIFKQIVSAISYCHSRGIVHRDLKMENVLFKDKNTLHIKVVDFGIAGVCKSNK